ncbi:hypothetical protein DM860_004512 [Cuscuta australis]|uniref:Uncharacterized protein n=1 Tax=Cuscuta australis TaxID=267555 RepID=A0A328EC24_9ASTE|nr:hypothetical protein DM860_004512 [Cuscuta australis]
MVSSDPVPPLLPPLSKRVTLDWLGQPEWSKQGLGTNIYSAAVHSLKPSLEVSQWSGANLEAITPSDMQVTLIKLKPIKWRTTTKADYAAFCCHLDVFTHRNAKIHGGTSVTVKDSIHWIKFQETVHWICRLCSSN